jgi:outer membrane protein assembly factor BamD
MYRRSLIALLLAAGLLTPALAEKKEPASGSVSQQDEKPRTGYRRESAQGPKPVSPKELQKQKQAARARKKKKSGNPLAEVDSKQPDKILYDHAMQQLKERKYDTARITLQTLINAYPDSEFVARAKLSVGEAWYQEGTTAALAQAETEFRDFITFFPNLPEAAEAQLKIADIHYRQMGKPDRDFTHARRAEEEYRQLLQLYPESKLVPEAKQHLLEVQELLAEREYRIARFYYGRQSLLPSIARAKTLTDTYPLYSGADQSYFMLGQSYEQLATNVQNSKLPDGAKQKLAAHYLDLATEAYTRMVVRYPAEKSVADARARLEALKRPVPTPTPEAIELNKKELASRQPGTTYERFMTEMGKRPDLSMASHVGEPTLTDPKQTDAPMLSREINALAGVGPAPAASTGKQEATLHPNDIPLKPPSQLNEVDPTASGESSSSSASPAEAASSSSDAPKDVNAKNSSSSRKQKKRLHLHIPIPF